MRKRFTPALIRSDRLVADAREATHGRIEIRDTSSRLLLRITAKGARSYITRPRFAGKSLRLTYDGPATVKNYTTAKAWADHVADLCAKGVDPSEEARRKSEEADSRRFALEKPENGRLPVVVKTKSHPLKTDCASITSSAASDSGTMFALPVL